MNVPTETTLTNRELTAGMVAEQPRQWAGPLGIAWLAAFLRTAAQTMSPSAVGAFFANLDAKDRLLSRLGWLLMLAVPVFATAGAMGPHASLNLSPWIKPIKFSMSFATFVWTTGLFLMALRIPAWQRRLARRVMASSVVAEMLCLAAQAWRNVPAGQGDFTDYLLAQGTTAMVSINTLITVWLLAVFFGKRERIRLADYAQIVAIRASMIIFLVGNAVGGYMLARGSHTVGAVDGGPGLPFVNWSTIGGDLRIAHFIAIHAIQIVPLFAWILWQMTPRPTGSQRRIAVYVVGALVALAVGGTFLQALMAQPFLAIGR
jgi:hypothetical protein